MAATLNYPERTDKKLAEEVLAHLANAIPFSTAFLFLEPGCSQVGQGTELARSIEEALKKSFQVWANSWMRPYLEDIVNRGPELEALLLNCAALKRGDSVQDVRDEARRLLGIN